jgi:hypothetical protein
VLVDGENHGGVCLLFDRARLTERIVASLRGQGPASPYYRRVFYTPEGPGAGATLDAGALVGKVSGDSVARYVDGHHDELFFLKADDWATEFEYRFVVTTPEVEFLFVDYADTLDAVVVGGVPKLAAAGRNSLLHQRKCRRDARGLVYGEASPRLTRRVEPEQPEPRTSRRRAGHGECCFGVLGDSLVGVDRDVVRAER